LMGPEHKEKPGRAAPRIVLSRNLHLRSRLSQDQDADGNGPWPGGSARGAPALRGYGWMPGQGTRPAAWSCRDGWIGVQRRDLTHICVRREDAPLFGLGPGVKVAEFSNCFRCSRAVLYDCRIPAALTERNSTCLAATRLPRVSITRPSCRSWNISSENLPSTYLRAIRTVGVNSMPGEYLSLNTTNLGLTLVMRFNERSRTVRHRRPDVAGNLMPDCPRLGMP